MHHVVRHWRATVLSSCLAALSLPVWAERPMAVEDASTMERGSAKVELGWSKDADHRGWDASIGYSPLHHVETELDLGHARDRPFTPSDTRRAVGAAVKWVPLQADQGLSAGLKYAYTRDRLESDQARHHVHALSALASWTFTAGPSLHLNLGQTWTRGHGHVGTWGVGGDMPVLGAWVLTLETFGEQERKPAYQAGLRYQIAQGLKLSMAGGRGNRHNMGNLGIAWEF